MITIEVHGLQELTQAFQRLAAQAEAALVHALRAEANGVLETSYPLVPYKEGDLVRSGTVLEVPDGAEVRYGNFGAVPYALVQHEDTTFQHPGGGEHHYLSKALFEKTDGMPQRLAAFLEGRLSAL